MPTGYRVAMRFIDLPLVLPPPGNPDGSVWNNLNWDRLQGWPLHVALIVIGGIVVLAVIRRLIAHVADQIAKGYKRAYQAELAAITSITNDDDGSEENPEPGEPSDPLAATSKRLTRKARRASKILVEDKLGLVTPEVKARRAQRARTIGSVLRSATTIVVVVTMIVLMLRAVGASEVVTYLMGTAGLAAVAIGFGAQTLVRDFLSGIFILLEDQFGVGDVVDLGFNVQGTVEQVDLRLTHVRGFDGTLWHVRNGEILRAGNRTQQWSRAVAEVKVPVGSNIDVVREALSRAVMTTQEDEGISAYLLEAPVVRGVDAITEGAYTFTMHAKVQPGRDGDVMRALLMAAYNELRTAEIIVTGASSEAD